MHVVHAVFLGALMTPPMGCAKDTHQGRILPWQREVVYQIYPRSFADANGDGVGDLPGILSKLDYLQDLGVDVVWLSPVYRSTHFDNGYDIVDHLDIDPLFGTLADWRAVLDGLHARHMKLVMDIVVNHTSDEHPWFLAERQRKSAQRLAGLQPAPSPDDFYIWRAEPNNWTSVFGGPAWHYDAGVGLYYLTVFTPHQVDLNWANPEVRRAVSDMMQTWVERGVDGFRMDVINLIAKDPTFADAPEGDGRLLGRGAQFYTNRPEVHGYLRELMASVDGDRLLRVVGETPGVSSREAVSYTAPDAGELTEVFLFEHMNLDSTGDRFHRVPWRLADLKRVVAEQQRAVHGRGWIANYLENHDQLRCVSRFGDEKHYREESAKLLALLLLTLEGTPYIYQGQEIGMTNASFADIHEVDDAEARGYYEAAVRAGVPPAEAMRQVDAASRDNVRTVMQWSAEPGAGFTSGKPWLKVNDNYREVNVAQAALSETSTLAFYKRALRLRREHDALVAGAFEPLLPDLPHIFAYKRSSPQETAWVLLNFAPQIEAIDTLPLPAGARLLTSTYLDVTHGPLRPYEGRVYVMPGA